MARFFPTVATVDGLSPAWVNPTDSFDTLESTFASAQIATVPPGGGPTYHHRFLRLSGFPSVSNATDRTINFLVRIVGAGTASTANQAIKELQVNWSTDNITIPGPYVNPNYKQLDTWLFQLNHDSGTMRRTFSLPSTVDTTLLQAQINIISYDEFVPYLLTGSVFEVYVETPTSGVSDLFAVML